MRLLKLFSSGLILAIVGIFLWQNTGTFGTLLPFSLDLYISEPVTWSHSVCSLLFFTGVLGLAAGILIMLRPYFNIRRLLIQEQQERLPSKQPASTPSPGKTETVE